jgi:acetoin utilization deacetylase AcuC-like enzyme
MTFEGLRARDRMVFSAARERGIPVVVVLAGGYALDVEDTVEVHSATVEECVRSAEGPRPSSYR